MKVAVVWGTRPEVIKLAPVVHALERTPLEVDCINTGQHFDLSLAAEDTMKVRSKHRIRHHLTYPNITDKLAAYGGFLEATFHEASRDYLPGEPYDAVICQGDTVTTLAAALAGFHQKIPVVHVEAGLRSGNINAPYPEEMHRRLITQLATLHCCPGPCAYAAIRAELGSVGLPRGLVTGNTIVDAVLSYTEHHPVTPPDQEFVLVTMHRRENEAWLGEFMRGLVAFAWTYPHINILFPQHPNPALVAMIKLAMDRVLNLSRDRAFPYPTNILMPGPLGYFDFLDRLRQSLFVVSDSGGVSEEAAILGKRQLITRLTTERNALVETGRADQIGAETSEDVFSGMERLLNMPTPLYNGQPPASLGAPGAGIRVANAVCDMLQVSHQVH